MCSFKLKIYQNLFGQSSAPDPVGGAYDAPSKPLIGSGMKRWILPISLPFDRAQGLRGY